MDAVAGSHPACSIVALRRGSARVARMTCAELGFGSCAKQLSCGFSYCLGALGSCVVVVVGRTALGTLRAALLVPTVSVCVCVCVLNSLAKTSANAVSFGICSGQRVSPRAACDFAVYVRALHSVTVCVRVCTCESCVFSARLAGSKTG